MKILIQTLNQTDGAALVRVDPFYSLKDHSVTVTTRASFQQINDCDVFYIHRGFLQEHLEMVLTARRLSKKVWADVDDHFLALEQDNPVYFVWTTPATQECVKRILSLAHVVTVSNTNLLSEFSPYNQNIHFIPCAYSEALLNTRKPPAKDRQKIITWRGSATHGKSLLEYADAICKVEQKHKDWTFIFVGQFPWWITDKFKNCKWQYIPWLEPMSYLNFMQEAQPAAHIVPLSDNLFTRCRSNSAWFDAAYGGALCLAPAWPNWVQPGVHTYSDPSRFEHQLNNIMCAANSGYNFSSEVEAGWQEIRQKWTAEKTNDFRIAILNQLTIGTK